MPLPIARYRYTFRMAQPLQLPPYAGSLLRGQFGAALRRASCITGLPRCEPCPVRGHCPYPAIFEAPAPAQHTLQRFSHIPNPYVIEPPPFGTACIPQGHPLTFNLVLIGRALEHLPLINRALQNAFAQGIGSQRARGTLQQIDLQHPDAAGPAQWAPIWQAGAPAIAPHNAASAQALVTAAPYPAQTRRIALRFTTPLRLQHQGQPVRPHALTPRKFIADLLRRISLLAEFHGGQVNAVGNVHQLVALAETLQHRRNLRWQDWSRYSSRQKQEMILGGAIGTWTFYGELTALLPWLHLGQWLHVGKNATLGLGAYQLLPLDTAF